MSTLTYTPGATTQESLLKAAGAKPVKLNRADRVLLDVANRRRLGADIVEAVTQVEVTRTMEGAATLTIAVRDDEGHLAGSDVLVRGAVRAYGDPDARALRPIDVRVGDEWFRLVKVSRQGPTTTLTFEDRVVAYLRAHDAARSSSRARVTRAQFVRGLVEEVGRTARRVDGERVTSRPINFYSAGVRTRLPIAPPSAQDRAGLSSRSEGRSAPAASRVARSAQGLTVKGKRANAEQRRNMVAVLGIAADRDAGAKATKALVLACIVEALFRNLPGGDRDSQGILQLRVGLHGRALARSVKGSAQAFLVKGFTRRGGAIAIAKANPGWSAGQVAQAVQGSGHPGRYDQYSREADRIIDALGGGGTAGGGRERPDSEPGSYIKQYRFARKAGEDSWTAIRRLAEEVNRRAWVVDNTVHYASDTTRLYLPAVLRLWPMHPAVIEIDWDLDYGKTVREATVRLSSQDLPDIELRPGEPVSLTQAGPADGKWLIWSTRETKGSDDVELVLRQPQPPKPEPRSQTGQRTQRASTTDSPASGGDESATDRAHSKAFAISRRNYPYVWGGGHRRAGVPDRGTGRDPGIGYDCSGYNAAVLLAGGMLPDAWKNGVPASGTFASSYGRPGRGRRMTVWANAGHMFIEFTIPGKRGRWADTSRAAGGPSGPHLRTGNRSTAGFTARHWPGT